MAAIFAATAVEVVSTQLGKRADDLFCQEMNMALRPELQAVPVVLHCSATSTKFKARTYCNAIHTVHVIKVSVHLPVREDHLDSILLFTATLRSLQAGQLSQIKHFFLLILLTWRFRKRIHHSVINKQQMSTASRLQYTNLTCTVVLSLTCSQAVIYCTYCHSTPHSGIVA